MTRRALYVKPYRPFAVHLLYVRRQLAAQPRRLGGAQLPIENTV